MVAIALSWIIISFVLFSAGDICIHLYKKICINNEDYGLLDTFIMGMCFIFIPLSLTSLWLPSNQYMLFAYIIISLTYWCFNKNRLKSHIEQIRDMIGTLTAWRKITIGLSVFSIFTFILWSSSSYDASYYHYQHIRWNEEYAVVPGLGNIEDRFGFNSNYMLLSALFTFRFLFGQAIYTTQALLFTFILCWVLMNLFKSKFNILNVILLVLTLGMFFNVNKAISDSNTDIIPSLCLFYIVSRTVFDPSWFKKKPLFICLVLVTLATFKISAAIFCLLCIVPLWILIQKKRYSELVYILTCGTALIVLWCIRNYYVSGYLVYPLPQLDLFDVDWKMPESVALLEQIHVREWADYMYRSPFILTKTFLANITNGKFDYFDSFIVCFVYGLTIASPLFALLCFIKKRKISRYLYLMYVGAFIGIVFWYFSAPDFRFAYGYIYGCAFLSMYFLIALLNKVKVRLPRLGIAICSIVVLLLVLSSVKNTLTTGKTSIEKSRLSVSDVLPQLLMKPQPHQDYANFIKHFSERTEEYQMGNFIIYVTCKGQNELLFDVIPSADHKGLPFSILEGSKMQSIRTIEPRGFFIQDGFRTKSEYIELLNNNIDQYIDYYNTQHEKKLKLLEQ